MNNFKSTAIAITVITIICKCFGFVREMAIAYFFGTSNIVDAFLMASAIPGIFFGWLGAIIIAYTPKFTEIKYRLGLGESQKYSNNIITFVVVLSGLCVLVTLLFGKKFIEIAAPGFTGYTFELTYYFLLIGIYAIFFKYISTILISFLDCNGKFLKSKISTLVVSSSQIIVILIAGLMKNANILIYSIIVSSVIQFLVLTIFAKQENFSYRPTLKFDDNLKSTMTFVIPIFISSMIMQINTFVDKSFASSLAEGSIAALNYADKIKVFLVSIFSIAIVTIIYPVLSKAVSEKRMDDLKRIVAKAINMIVILFMPITAGALLLARPAMTVIYMRGQFDENSLNMTIIAFTMYAIGIMFIALRDVITRVFYSLQDTKSTLVVGAIAVSFNIVLNFLLVGPMGHAGLALSTSISAICSIPLFLFFLKRKIGSLGLTKSAKILIKAMISTVAMAIAVYFINRYFSGISEGSLYSLISIVVSVIVGAIIYYAMMVIMKVEEMEAVTNVFRKMKNKVIK